MRTTLEPENDSGGFSLVSADGVSAIVEDQRENDSRFVEERLAMLFSLVGDDAVRVRVVVDEGLTPEEESALQNRIRGGLDLRKGVLLVCGGFDPRSLDAWQGEGSDPNIAELRVPPGWYRVTIGATLGCNNGQAIAAGGEEEWLASDEPPKGPAPEYGWVAQLERVPDKFTATSDATEADEAGWFAVEAGTARP